MAEALGIVAVVVGIEVADRSPYYDWHPTGSGLGFHKETLFPGRTYHDVGAFARYRRLVARCLALRARYVLLCHYNEVEYFGAAVTLRLLGRRVYTMFDSKFDDKPRSAWRELCKKALHWPYCGALVSGPRARAYLQFLGYSNRRIAEGYDTLSIARVRALAGAEPAPGGAPFGA
ncbi:MAG: glycosyl transferase family 1, partial [Alphaproteobacteria bacterium]